VPACVVGTVQCSLHKYKKYSKVSRQATVKQEQGEVGVSVTNIIQLTAIQFFIITRRIEGILFSERRISKTATIKV
jgi:hypothetical protein